MKKWQPEIGEEIKQWSLEGDMTQFGRDIMVQTGGDHFFFFLILFLKSLIFKNILNVYRLLNYQFQELYIHLILYNN